MGTLNRLTSLLAGLAVAVGLAAPADAQDAYPNKPVKLMVPYAPGGLPDTIARVVGQRIGEAFSQQFVVENRPGAGGIAGCEIVARAAPDGYILLIADVGQLAINPALYAKLPYDSVKDFAPISLVAITPLFIAAHNSVAANDLSELIQAAKARPGELTYGSSGTGSIHHLTMEALKSGAGINLVHVPYKGAGQSIPALIGGQVALAPAALPALASHIKAGRLKLLAVNTHKRSALAPDVPTVAEITGISDFHYPSEIGFLAPSGTPKTIVEKLALEIGKALQHPDTTQRLVSVGVDIVGSTPEAYAANIQSGIERYSTVVRAAGAKAD